jgi:hypothetical protein
VGTVDKTDYDDDIPVSSIDFDFDDKEERADDAQVLSLLYMIFETPIQCCFFDQFITFKESKKVQGPSYLLKKSFFVSLLK